MEIEMKKLLLIIIFSLFASIKAYALNEANFQNLSKLAVKFNAVNLAEKATIKDYSKIFYCEIYTKYYNNELEWAKIEKAMKATMIEEVKNFPLTLYYDSTVDITKYDVLSKGFNLTKANEMHRLGVFDLYFTVDNICGYSVIGNTFYSNYQIVLENPITLSFLPTSEEFAKKVIKNIAVNDEENRSVYVRFYFTVNKFNPTKNKTFKLIAKLDKVDFFADAEKKEPFYTYISNN